jgi:hypothetical protein
MLKNRLGIILSVVFIIIGMIPLSGCWRNTPEQISQRFIMSIQSLKWDNMIKMVDWETTAQNIRNASNAEARKDIIISFASSFTRSSLRKMTDEEIRHKMLYMSVLSTTVIEQTENKAKVKVKCLLNTASDQNTSEATFRMRKINREWKVILIPEQVESNYNNT